MLDYIKLMCEWLGYSALLLFLAIIWIMVIITIVRIRDILTFIDDFQNPDNDTEDYL